MKNKIKQVVKLELEMPDGEDGMELMKIVGKLYPKAILLTGTIDWTFERTEEDKTPVPLDNFKEALENEDEAVKTYAKFNALPETISIADFKKGIDEIINVLRSVNKKPEATIPNKAISEYFRNNPDCASWNKEKEDN